MPGIFGKKKANAQLFQEFAERVLSKQITVEDALSEAAKCKVTDEAFMEIMSTVKHLEHLSPKLAYTVALLAHEVVRRGDYNDLMRATSALTLADLSASTLGLYNQSIELYQYCINTYHSLSARIPAFHTHPGESISLGNLGIVYGELGHYQQARRYLEQALVLSREIGDRKNERRWLYNLGNVHALLEDYERAVEYYEQALHLNLLFNDKLGEEICLGELGAHVYAKVGDYYKAKECHEQALRISRQIKDKVGEASNLGDLGHVSIFLGNYEEAIRYLEQGLNICRTIGHKELEVDQLRFLGTAYLNLGEIEKAGRHYLKALEISQGVSDGKSAGAALYNLADFYLTLGDLEKGEEYLRQALEVAEKTGTRSELGRLLGGFAVTYAEMGKPKRAKEFLEQALRISRETSDIQAESNWLGQVGNMHRLTGELEKAIEFHEQALAISLKIGNTLGQITQLVNLGLDHRLRGEYLKARDKYLEAIKIAETIGNVEVHRIALADLGILYARYLKDHEKAYATLTQAIALLEEMRSSLVSEEFKITFVGERINAYSEMVLLCLAMGREKEAFEYAERGKSRALIDLIGNARVDPKKGEEKGLVIEAERLRCLINRLWKEIEQIPPEMEDRRNPKFEEKMNRIRETERKEIEIWNEIKRRNPEYNSLRQVDPITLEETQKMLDEKIALIEYYVTQENTIAFVVTKNKFYCKILNLSQKNLSEMLTDPTTNKLIEPSRENAALVSDILKDLQNVLFAPLKEILEKNGIKAIYFSPHGLLHLLPFHALYEDTEDGRHFVIQDYAVAYVPSASVLKYCMKKGNKQESLFAVKNPDGSLKFADSEVEGASKLFERKTILDQANGTRENVLSKASSHGTVHFACHGLFRGDIPQQSGLKLADGWLTMIDILNNLTLDADLVTMSACQTGKAKLTGGDEVVGLTRAFLYAGASSVIASLWSVDDESTSMLFQKFYSYLRQGEDKAKALQKAQIEVMNFRNRGTFGRPFSHPYFWAPFLLIGEWRSSAL